MDRVLKKRKWTGKKIITYSSIGLFAFLLVYLIFIRDSRSTLYVAKDELTIAEVKWEEFQEYIPLDGVVQPKNTVFVDAVMGGNVVEVYVEDGAILKPGEPIAQLVNANLELSYMEQETRIYEALNNLQNTALTLEQNKYFRQQEILDLEYQIDQFRLNFERQRRLYADSLISAKEYEDAERDYLYNIQQKEIALKLQQLDSISTARRSGQIEATMRRMQNNLALLQKNLENLTVKAPAEGKLSGFDLEVGQTIVSGEHLGQIDERDGFKLRANIDERYINRVGSGQKASFDFEGKTYHLSIRKIYTDVSNGSFQVDLYFDNDQYPKRMKRGQTIQLRLEFSNPVAAVLLKRGGFFQETGGNWIYVLDASEAYAIKRNIRINRQNSRYYEVVEGLVPGEKVIISSYNNYGNKERIVFKD